MKVAYLVSEYPALSHAFVTREIRTLREMGWAVHPFSIRTGHGAQAVPDEVEDGAVPTFAILEQGLINVLLTQLRMLVRSPAALALGARMALAGSRTRRRADVLRRVGYLCEAVVLLSQLRDRRISHVHVHFANGASEVARIAASMSSRQRHGTQVTFSVTVHSLAMHGLDNSGRQNWPTRNASSWGTLEDKAKAAAFIVCISEFVRLQLLRLLPAEDAQKLLVIHMGVDPRDFPYRRPPEGRDVGQVLFVGRLADEKAPGVVVEAVLRLLATGVGIHLTIVGRGPLEADLRRMVEARGSGGHISLVGAKTPMQLSSLYHAADVLCLPSRVEGVPVVLMEAMSSGVPVIASDTDGIPELVVDGQTGLLVQRGDAHALADALEKLLGSNRLREELAEAARQKIDNDYRSSSAVAALAEALAPFCGDVPAGPLAHPDVEVRDMSDWELDKRRYGPFALRRELSAYAVALYRIGRWNDRRPDGLSKSLVGRAYWPAYRLVEALTGISLPKEAVIGGGLRIHHAGPIVVHPSTVIGKRCTLRHGVTLGQRTPGGGLPVLGDDVEVGVHAQILGPVSIGDGARIGAMALVLDDVPAGGVARGARATVIGPQDSR